MRIANPRMSRIILAENQPEYNDLPCLIDYEGISDTQGVLHPGKRPLKFTAYFEPTRNEIVHLTDHNSLIHLSVMGGHLKIQPVIEVCSFDDNLEENIIVNESVDYLTSENSHDGQRYGILERCATEKECQRLRGNRTPYFRLEIAGVSQFPPVYLGVAFYKDDQRYYVNEE